MSKMIERMATALYFESQATDALPMEQCIRYAEVLAATIREPTDEIENLSTASIYYSAGEIWRMMVDAEFGEIKEAA